MCLSKCSGGSVSLLSSLLYGVKTWAAKAIQTRRTENFLNHCISCILDVFLHVQWREHIITEQLALKFGMTEGASVLLALLRSRWPGHMHVGRMTDDHLSKQIRFGELLTTRPFHWPKL